ncbi:sensor histidine kinase [Planomonospora corallina]|uniref:Sensor histidine kinase n=1 Tax=Planomonospora corallina TaxID=1806052 RepID=A0ABV8I1D2_9ACTN
MALAAAAVVMVVAGAVARFAMAGGPRPAVLTGDDVVGIAYPVLGALLVLRRPGLRVGWLMVAGGFATAVLGPSQAVYEWIRHSGDPAALHWPAAVNAGVGTLATVLVDLLLPLFYPDGRLPSRRWIPVAVAVPAFTLLQGAALVCRSAPAGSPRGPNPLEAAWAGPLNDWFAAVPVNTYYVAEAVCLFSLLFRFASADAVGRRQIGWLLYAVAANLMVEFHAPFSPAAMVTSLAVPAAVAVAVTRHHLYAIDTLVSRTVIVAGLLGALGAVYFGGVALAGLVVSDHHQFVGMGAVLLAGAFFHPIHRGLRRLLDRAFYGPGGDPELLAARVRRAVAHDTLGGALTTAVETVRDGLAVTGTAMEVNGVRTAAGELPEVVREVPLVWHGVQVGRLLIGPAGVRRLPDSYQERVLAALVPYVADAAHAAWLTCALTRSRERVLSAREEERRRLYRDVHDGLGRSISVMARSVNEARGSVRTSPEEVDLTLRRLRAGMDAASAQIRELVYGLRPPALDDLGLEGAVRALAGDDAAVVVTGDLTGLPGTVEAAAYRIVRHVLAEARGRPEAADVRGRPEAADVRGRPEAADVRGRPEAADVRVGLARSDRLRVTVEVGGKGLPGGAGPDMVREYAAEAGGTCAVRAAPGDGTVVEAVLPG